MSIAAVLILTAQNVPVPVAEAAPTRPRLVTTMARVYPVEVTIATPTPRPAPVSRPDPAKHGTGACGGDLPSCAILDCESGGNLTAANPSSSARGKWQITSGTWNNYGGYSSADQAPEEVQDAKARELKRSRGNQPWTPCL